MFQRWAEERLYRRTMQLAVAELRRAARAANLLEKLQALDTAEQKLKDAAWLRPEAASERFQAGLGEIARSRLKALSEQAPAAVERLLEAAQRNIGDQAVMLEAAGALLTFLFHYLPEDARAQALSARFRELGGKQPPYQPVPPLAEIYHRPHGGLGCGGLIAGLILIAALLRYAAG
jgi:hypothetical protein